MQPACQTASEMAMQVPATKTYCLGCLLITSFASLSVMHSWPDIIAADCTHELLIILFLKQKLQNRKITFQHVFFWS